MEKETDLPIRMIEGTAFLVDVTKKEFREVGNEENGFSILEMKDLETHYEMEYDIRNKAMANIFSNQEDVVIIQVPQLTELHPEGMAKVYDKPLNEILGRSDFEIMVDQDALNERLMGKLNTIDIEGHLFYIDMRMDCIRPKDDYSTEGIPMLLLEEHFSMEGGLCVVTYNPKTHSYEPINYETITAIPEHLIVIEFPGKQQLDPIGYARRYELDQRECVRQTPIQRHFTAKKVEWVDTNIPKVIEQNKEKISQKAVVKERPPKKRKGQKM